MLDAETQTMSLSAFVDIVVRDGHGVLSTQPSWLARAGLQFKSSEKSTIKVVAFSQQHICILFDSTLVNSRYFTWELFD